MDPLGERLRRDIENRLWRAIDEKVAPGFAVAAGIGDHTLCETVLGRIGCDEAYGDTNPSTLWDLASLTKPIVGASLVGLALQQGLVSLDDSPARFHPAYGSNRLEQTTVRDLLLHASGQPASIPFFVERLDRNAVRRSICTLESITKPGHLSEYSDLDFLILWDVLETAFESDIASVAERLIFQPLAMRETMFSPGEVLKIRCAPTEYCHWRGRMIQGEVHDENCASLGGVTPHAGLFATISDVSLFLRAVLRSRNGDNSWMNSEIVNLLTTRAGPIDGNFALGWVTPADGRGRRGNCLLRPFSLSAAGSAMSASSFGHTGFTGTSMVADPSTGRWVVILSNRVHPTRKSKGMPELRRDLSDLVALS